MRLTLHSRSGLAWRFGLVGIALVVRWLFGSLLGILFTSIVLYCFLNFFGMTQPLSASQLVLWIDELSSDAQAAVFTTLMTIVGFLIAFATATLNWKQQSRAALYLEVASELQTKFTKVGHVAQDLKFFVESQVEACEKASAIPAADDAELAVRFQIDHLREFRNNQKLFSEHLVDVHGFVGRYGVILAGLSNSLPLLERANQRVSAIADAMWITLPYVRVDVSFLESTNLEECRRFIATCEESMAMHEEIGAIRGRLLAPTTDFTISSWLTFVRSKAFRSAILGKSSDED